MVLNLPKSLFHIEFDATNDVWIVSTKQEPIEYEGAILAKEFQTFLNKENVPMGAVEKVVDEMMDSLSVELAVAAIRPFVITKVY